jgi:predicted nucleotidyltransferase
VRDTRAVTITQLRARRTEIERTARQFGASNIRVFGSVARGEASPDSDVDLLVDMERGRGLLALAGLELALESLLGSDVDVTTPGGLRPRARQAVLVEAVPL